MARKKTASQPTKTLLKYCNKFRDRLMVGRQVLVLKIGVRVPIPDP